MNPNYCHTITLYNCLKARDNPDKKDVWIRTVLYDCFYKASTMQVQNGTEAAMTNTYTVRIPESQAYLPYHRWKSLPAAARRGYFTVSENDIVIHGECFENITGEGGNTAPQLMQRYKPDAFKVTSFSDNTAHRMGKHYRLGG